MVMVVVVVVGLYSPGLSCARPPDAGPLSSGPSPKFRFFPSPAPISFFFCLSGCLLVEFLGPPGLPHDSPRTPNVHISGPGASKHHQNSTRKHLERQKKNEIVAGEEKKTRNFGPPSLRGPTLRGPTFGARAERSSANLLLVEGWLGQKTILAKVGLAKVGHPNFGQSRSIKVGQSRSTFFWPKSVWPKSDWPKSVKLRMAKVGLAKVGLSRCIATGTSTILSMCWGIWGISTCLVS